MKDMSSDTLLLFGKNLEKIKKAKKLSYRKIAANCNIEHSDIKRYVDGKINPTLLSLLDLAKGLDVHPSELLNF
ncbi:transcriptional regulator with XRE-family HTH domain [Flavobacterium sp. W4I14]|nr:transcriptional regulator with XRE-family HTH domain [Flavobacterium sp. W4I14]